MLSLLGAETVSACDAKAAYSAVQKGNFDMVLLDIHLPGENGFSVANKLRNIYHFTAPIIAVSADDTMNQNPEAFAIDSFLTKPVSMNDLKQQIAMMLPFNAASQSMA